MALLPVCAPAATQVQRIIKLGAVPSFTGNIMLELGDYLTKTFGKEREHWITPAGAFQKANAL
jgi:predicted amidohydrolase YtcJ